MNRKVRGMVFTIISALLFGVTPILASMTYDMGSNANTLTFYRNLMVVPVLLVIMLIKKTPLRVPWKELLFLLAVSVLFSVSTTYMLYESYNYVGVGTAQTIHFLYPVVTALLCRFLFRERLGRWKLAALIAASAGMLFFLDGGGSMIGIILAVASAVTYGCYLTSMDKSSLRSMNPNKVACYMGLFNACAMLLMDIPMQKINFFLPPLAMLYTFIVAIGTSFLAVALLQLGIRDLGASTAAVFCMFEPVSSVLSGWLFLHEAMTWQKALGCVIILGGVTMMVLSDLRNQRRTEALGEPQRYVRKEMEAGAPQAAVQVSTEMAAPVETAAGEAGEASGMASTEELGGKLGGNG